MTRKHLARATALAAALAAPVLEAVPAKAQAGTDYEAIVRLMRECARIADVPSRVACYDNNVGRDVPRADTAFGTPPQARAAPAQSPSPAPRATGFAADSLPQTREERAAQINRIELKVTAISELEPRVYRLTLDDGGVWETTEPAPRSFDPPRRGSSIALSRAALGGFLLDYADQPTVRIRRVK